jgi:hypothetical protein
MSEEKPIRIMIEEDLAGGAWILAVLAGALSQRTRETGVSHGNLLANSSAGRKCGEES